jgi:cytochrome P450
MGSVTELALEHLPLETQALAEAPLPYFEAARARHPWLAASNLGFVVTEYHAIREILQQDEVLGFPGAATVEIMGAHGAGWGEYVAEFMLSRTGAAHARLRGAIAEAFTPRAVNRLRDLMRKSVSDVLDEWAPKGAFDFAEFASNFPVRVMFGLIGADPAAVPAIKRGLEVYGASFAMDPTQMPGIEAAFQDLLAFVEGVVAERGRGGGHDDLLDDLIAAATSGVISEVELRQLLIFLFGAGYDTSKNQLTLIAHALLDRPDLWARCGEDRAFCAAVVEEGLRYASSSNTFRVVTEDFEHRGVTFPKGLMLIFPLAISSHDAGTIPSPEVFDPDRRHEDRHLAFGRGRHICLGQFLARANLEEGLHLTAQRITRPRLAGEVTWRAFPGTWGVKSLPIAFEPAPRRPEIETSPAGSSPGAAAA